MEVFKRVISTSYLDLLGIYYNSLYFFCFLFYYNRHFLPFRRADLTTSGVLRRNAVEYHSFIRRAYHLRQPRLVNNPG